MLNIVNETGDFKPWVKFNAKAGRWYVKGDNGDVEVVNPAFVADFANVQTGYFYFAAGAAPQRKMDKIAGQAEPKPDLKISDGKGGTKDAFKRGFSLDIFSQNAFGGVVELSSTADSMCGPINELYVKYLEAPESKQGLLPVIAVKGVNPIVGKHGTNYAPIFAIEKWVSRPSELMADPIKAAAPAPQSPPPAAVSSVSEF